MSRKTVRIVSLVIAAIIVLVFVGGVAYELVYSETDAERLEREKQEAQENLEENRAKREKTLAAMEGLEKEVADIQGQINAINAQIETTSVRLAEEEVKLEEATEKAETQYAVFKERFRIMCEQGDVGFLELLFTSENFTDMIDRAEVMREIAEYDKLIFDRMEENRKTIETSRNAIADLKESQEKDRSSLASQKDALVAKQEEQRAYMSELESDAAAYQKVIDEADAAMERLRQQASRSLSRDGGGTVYEGGDFAWPTPSCHYITSSFSPRRKNPVTGVWKRHTGTDIGAGYGAQIVAANGGTVTLAGWNSGYGNCVIIDHGGGRATLYAHMSSFCVSAGQRVERGQHIGNVGSTGNSRGPHLHFEVLINGAAVDPMQFF